MGLSVALGRWVAFCFVRSALLSLPQASRAEMLSARSASIGSVREKHQSQEVGQHTAGKTGFGGFIHIFVCGRFFFSGVCRTTLPMSSPGFRTGRFMLYLVLQILEVLQGSQSTARGVRRKGGEK